MPSFKLNKSVGERLAERAEKFAHDIRSPITALLVLADSEPGISSDSRDLLLRIGERILDDVQGLLRNDSEQESAAELCFLPDRIESLLKQKRIELGIHMDAMLLHRGLRWRRCFAQVVPSDLDGVISNLLNNAFEAAGDDGIVDIGVGMFGANIRITVEDNGPGIHPSIRSRVLRERITFGKSGGSGIGLWEAEQFARRVGGDVQIVSSERGTRITLNIPLRASV